MSRDSREKSHDIKSSEWANKFADIDTYNNLNAQLSQWIRDIYSARKVLIFFHSIRLKRYTLSHYAGISRSVLGKFIFKNQPFIRIDTQELSEARISNSISLKEWKRFTPDMLKILTASGLNRILPLWVGKYCVGGIIFDMPSKEIPAAAASFESTAGDLAYLMEIAYVKQLHERKAWQINVLLEIDRKISSLSDLQNILDYIIDSLKEVISYNAAGVFLVKENSKSIEYRSTRGFPGNMQDLCDLKVGQGLVGWSIEHGEEVNIPDVRKDSRYVQVRKSTRSLVAVPIIFGNKVIGAIALESDTISFFRYFHQEILRAFAAQTAIVLNNSKLLYESLSVKQIEKELEIAHGIQKTLLRQEIPIKEGYDFAALNFSSRAIGGDLYDFIDLSENEIGIAIGDVSGKGIPGALLMSTLISSLREQARINQSPDEVTFQINNILFKQTESDKFATFFYGILDTQSNVFRYTNAGHNHPLLLYPNNKYEKLYSGGPLIGVFHDYRYISDSVLLNPGDVLLMYTDGLSEAMNVYEEEFGEERILECLKTYKAYSASEIINKLLR